MADDAKEWSPDQVRPGQIRRDDEKHLKVTVEKIENSDVHANYQPLDVPGSTGFSVWSLEKFSQFPLLSDPEAPLWRVSGQLSWNDAAVGIYAQIGSVIGYESHQLTKGGVRTGVVSIDVVAPDAEIAKQRVVEVAPLAGQTAKVEDLDAVESPDD